MLSPSVKNWLAVLLSVLVYCNLQALDTFASTSSVYESSAPVGLSFGNLRTQQESGNNEQLNGANQISVRRLKGIGFDTSKIRQQNPDLWNQIRLNLLLSALSESLATTTQSPPPPPLRSNRWRLNSGASSGNNVELKSSRQRQQLLQNSNNNRSNFQPALPAELALSHPSGQHGQFDTDAGAQNVGNPFGIPSGSELSAPKTRKSNIIWPPNRPIGGNPLLPPFFSADVASSQPATSFSSSSPAASSGNNALLRKLQASAGASEARPFSQQSAAASPGSVAATQLAARQRGATGSDEVALHTPIHSNIESDYEFKRVENARWNNLRGMWGKRAINEDAGEENYRDSLGGGRGEFSSASAGENGANNGGDGGDRSAAHGDRNSENLLDEQQRREIFAKLSM